MLNVYYIANTGFLIKCGDKKVLIDGIHSKKVKPYETVSKETLKKIIKGKPPFDDLNLLLFTHHHWDHFDGYLTLEALKHQPQLKLFSTIQTVSQLKILENYDVNLEDRILSDHLPLRTSRSYTINGIDFEAFSLQHDGEQYKDVSNYGYMINSCGETVFHCGDAKPSLFNYENSIGEKDISMALLDFPYISLTTGRKLINTVINPHQILLMHLPNKNEDTFQWLKSLHKVIDRYGNNIPPLTLCENTDTWVK